MGSAELQFDPETCWIADCKELHGLPLGATHNRRGEARTKPCPPDKQPLPDAPARRMIPARNPTTLEKKHRGLGCMQVLLD